MLSHCTPSAGVPTGDGCMGGGERKLHIDRGGMGGGRKISNIPIIFMGMNNPRLKTGVFCCFLWIKVDDCFYTEKGMCYRW